jgi:hypothetical protein
LSLKGVKTRIRGLSMMSLALASTPFGSLRQLEFSPKPR